MFEEQEITRLSKQYNFRCNVFYNSILINSPYRDWICEIQRGCYILKHVNGVQHKYKNHVHKKLYNNIEDIFKYINKHDTQVILNRDRNRKFERLYSQL